MAHEEAYFEVPMTAPVGGSPDAVAIFDTVYGRELRRAMISGHYAGALLFGRDESILLGHRIKNGEPPTPPGWAVYPAGAPS